MLAAALGAQALFLLVDEFLFHYRRGLGRWEKMGHPIDTASILLCLAFLVFTDPTPKMLNWYIGASAFSTLLVTKDEWVHARECSPTEHWLHAVLFVLHPIVLILLGWHWYHGYVEWPKDLVVAQFCLVATFAVYQTLYWNLWHGRK